MKLANLRTFASLLLIFCFLTTPIVAVAEKGEKNFKQGMKHEEAGAWDKAAEEFALAVAASPKNAEYLLHYRRALFNASQMMMQRGRTLAEQKDYIGAYNAFRAAYGYDPVNELAKSEMDRMLRLQQGSAPKGEPQNELPKDGTNTPPPSPTAQPPGVKLVPTAYTPNYGATPAPQDPPQVEQLRDIKYTKVDLKTVIKDLAQGLDLNVIFDSETFRSPRDVTIELKNVTSAQALDYIFLQEGLFFQKIGKRAILVASQNRRQNFQQLVLRTFYLANAKPQDVQKVLQQAIPPQPGRPPTQTMIDEATNSLTVRDTSENIKLIGNLIKSLDKDRAEVVMDVNIYEVTKTDLLRLGAQIGDQASLTNLGGSRSAAIGLFGNDSFRRTTGSNGAVTNLPINVATGLLLPPLTVSAFQSKNNAKLLASTQIHAFNNEESQARIGQRVPVQTAQVYNFGQSNNAGAGVGSALGNGYPVINYEQVGLTLKFTPIVFPNQDVQVKMSIESKDVAAGTDPLVPVFTERSINGTARIQNNRTLLLASVAQDAQTHGRQGIPLLGLIPVLGRLFSTPNREKRQVDIVIAVTPRVLRAPNILPEDEIEQPTGSIAVPTNSSLANMLVQEDREDQLAAARRLGNAATVQLPDAKPEDAAAPAYVPANTTTNNQPATATTTTVSQPEQPAVLPKPIDTSVKTLNIAPTSEPLDGKEPEKTQTEAKPAVPPFKP